jgi:6-phosphogluconolactonase
MSSSFTSAQTHPDQTQYLAYIGTYGKGIEAFRFDAGSGKLEPLGQVGQLVNPSFLAVDRDFHHMYAVSEVEGNTNGGVGSFTIDRKSGKLSAINSVGSAGVAPCHLSVDHTGKMLVVANYTTGQVSSFPIENDGKLGDISSVESAHGSGPNKERQEGPHAHGAYISVDNKRVYTPDLGLDQIRIYKLDLAHQKLVPNDPPVVHTAPGLGPRHLAFDAKGKFVYVLNEIKPVAEVFSVDSSNGNLTLIQSVPTLPANFTKENTGAEARISPNGKFLYTSNRGADEIQVFAIDHASGKLSPVQSISTGGKEPRGFNLDPTGRFLIAGNQNSNSLVVFRVDEKTGQLTPSGEQAEVKSPVDVLFVPAE